MVFNEKQPSYAKCFCMECTNGIDEICRAPFHLRGRRAGAELFRSGPPPGHGGLVGGAADRCAGIRSEEHTSELQSLMRISYAVFCLKQTKTEKQLKKYKT